MSELLNKVIAVSIGLFIAAILVPVALVTLANASLDGVDPSVVVIVTILLPVLAVIAIAMYFLRD